MNDIQVTSCREQGHRDNLEDALGALSIGHLLSPKSDIAIAIVADGVGGNNYGEIASNEVVNTIEHLMASSLAAQTPDRSITPHTLRNLLRQHLIATNDLILSLVDNDPTLKGMSTTVVCAVIADGTLHVGWAGDSRCYLYRRKRLKLLTKDHTEAQLLVDKGLLDTQYAQFHPLSHMINQYIGKANDFEPETATATLYPGDIILLTTDGLTDALTDKEIASLVRKYQEGNFSFKRLPSYLVESALAAGSTDNITVLCCEYAPKQVPIHNLFESTLTGTYPAEFPKVLRNLNKETQDVRSKRKNTTRKSTASKGACSARQSTMFSLFGCNEHRR